MKRLLMLLFSMLYLLSDGTSQVPVRARQITFRMVSPLLPDDTSVFICGNLPQLAGWNPGKLKMTAEGNHTWNYTIATETLFPVEYKYTLGSWEREAASMPGNPLPNFIIKVRSDTTITDTVKSWMNRQSLIIKGQVTGTLKYLRNIRGEGLRDRDIVIWLPPGYESDKGKRYPVIYMHDGQNLFDPLTSSFGTDWQMDETCDSLIRRSVTGPVIIAGVYNSPDRMKEYTPGQMGDNYINFMIRVVKPLIDSTFRTLPGRAHTYTGGSSAGGTISFMLAWRHPEIFSKAFCLSPAFKIQNIDVVKEVAAYEGKKKKLEFYIDNGGKGLEERLQPGVDEMIKALEMKGYRRNKELFTVNSPGDEHNEAAWAKRMPGALVLMLKK